MLSNKINQKGFTIVELLIVIVVIAILAAISIAAYTNVQNRARNSAAAELAGQLAGKASAYHAIRGTYPTLAQFGTGTGDEATPESSITGMNVIAPTTPHSTAFTNGTQVYYAGGGTTYTITYRLNDGTTTRTP